MIKSHGDSGFPGLEKCGMKVFMPERTMLLNSETGMETPQVKQQLFQKYQAKNLQKIIPADCTVAREIVFRRSVTG